VITEDAHRKNIEMGERLPDWILIGYIICLGFLYLIISGRRFFDFDEFQVMYASVGILRKGALYADGIGIHFPLANLLMSLPCSLVGFDAVVLLISRYIVLALNGIMLIYVYRIGSLLWSQRAGLLAVSMALSSFVFSQKGIEIRHDVFNALFSAMGVYYGLSYSERRRNQDLVFSALCLGMAIACTQKASVMAAGFIIGFLVYLISVRDYRSMNKAVICYLVLAPIPLVVCLMLLIELGNDSITAFFKHAVGNVIVSFAPHTDNVYPFPYNRLDLFKRLFTANPLYYVFCVSSIVSSLLSLGKPSKRVIVAICAAVGLIFFVTAKRPFSQTLLPVIPMLSVMGGGLLSSMWHRLRKWDGISRSIVGILCFMIVFGLPFYNITKWVSGKKQFERALVNAAFCVENLDENDKVLCFTQNQIFFDPLLRMSNDECGKRIYDYDADCIERKMIEAQCKVIIYDHRTQWLNEEIIGRIFNNYIKIKNGDILVPGFQIPPMGMISKNVWISGSYYGPDQSLEVDGRELDEKVFPLEQGHHTFKNMTDRPVTLVYVFDPDRLKKSLSNL
jgi:hypothetical protein